MLTLIAIALMQDWSLTSATVPTNQAVVEWSIVDTQTQTGGDLDLGAKPAEPVDDITSRLAATDWPAGVSIEFWGTKYCEPCKRTRANAEAVAGSVDYHDADAESVEAGKLGITTVPVMFLVRDGKQVKRLGGSFGQASILKLAKEVAGETRYQYAASSDVDDSGRITMSWNWNGDWNPARKQMIDHLATHNIDAEGMNRQQMADAHDAAHGTRRVAQVANRSQPVRLISRGGGCPNGRCPR
jgi:thiol-disulfide isomerase/thioredoxin